MFFTSQTMKPCWRFRFVLTLASVVTAANVIAQSGATNIPPAVAEIAVKYKTTPPVKQRVVEANVYYFTRTEYFPAVRVRPVENLKLKRSTPEAAAIAQLNSMYLGDYEAWLNGWSKTSQESMTKRNKELGRDGEFWKQAWKKVMAGKTAELVTRCETGEYVIIHYRLFSESAPAAAEEEVAGTVVVKNENGVWLATQELAADPVLLGWKEPGKVIERTIRQ
jgi:hypothetical protein